MRGSGKARKRDGEKTGSLFQRWGQEKRRKGGSSEEWPW